MKDPILVTRDKYTLAQMIQLCQTYDYSESEIQESIELYRNNIQFFIV